jgi:diacylglycerol kinase (ATP)
MKTVCVVNEHAGGGAMADIFRRMEHDLEAAVGPFDVVFTDGPGHATTLVRDALRAGAKRIYAGGGDGTLNECINGFFESDGTAIQPEAALGMLSGGTGGDFRKTIGLASTEDALRALAGGKVVRADIGRVTYRPHDSAGQTTRYFLNIASFGLSGLVDKHVTTLKQFGGKVAYYGATLMSLWGWKNPRVTLTFDGETTSPRPIVTVAVGNGRYFGGGMKVCPDARIDSGHFQVTTLGDLSRLELMLMSRSLYSGLHVYDPRVSVRTAKVVVAESDTPVHLDIDGEPLGTLPARFEVLPGAIGLVVP